MRAIILAVLGLPAVCHGFGAKAHRLAGHIAESQLCAAAATTYAEILPDMPLAEAGLWADQIRSDRAWDFARPWHYMNVPDDMPIPAANRSEKGDVLGAIMDFSADLADPEVSGLARETALLMLVHFVVDIHQPLHVGRKSDLGGNRIEVRAGEYSGNLHAYWDSGIFAQLDGSAPTAARLFEAADPPLLSLAMQTDPVVWATESQQLRPSVYAFGYDADGRGTLDTGYQSMAVRLGEERLVLAGLRLAGLLNSLWCAPSGEF